MPLSTPWRRWAIAALSAVALYALYGFGLARVGLLGPDEPRYAAIGRAMAQSGDWITPRLWGRPWFEKPALLYWMTGIAFRAGLDEDLAPRMPVALASIAFLIYFFLLLRREFGARAAFFSATILATSAGWLAFSHIGVTDLPVSAALAMSMLLAMRGKNPVFVGVFLGLAVLAKGLLPLALFLPAVWFWRKDLRGLTVLFAVATLIAAPWYLLMTMSNGRAFLDEFFWRHHFARYLTSELQHVQPFWYFVPMLLAGIFPWTPLIVLTFSKRLYSDSRARFLLAWFAWGFLFVSGARNKLPGYLLPMLPAAAALIGLAMAEVRQASVKMMALLAACAYLLWFIPVIDSILPQALLVGLSRARFVVPPLWVLVMALALSGLMLLERSGRREAVVGTLGLIVAAGVVWTVLETYPVLDRQVSPRGYWREHGASVACVPLANRSWRYGLDYYAGRELPDCN